MSDTRAQQIKDLFHWDGKDVEVIDRELNRILAIGPTGESPVVADPNDQGGLCASLDVENTGTLILDFGKSVTFLRMTPEEAIVFGSSLLQRGRDVQAALASVVKDE